MTDAGAPAGQAFREPASHREATSRKLSLGAAAAVVVAAFLNWQTTNPIGTATTSGIETSDGVVLACAAGVFAAVGLLRDQWSGGQRVSGFLLGVVSAGLGIVNIIDVNDAIREWERTASIGRGAMGPGIGLYLLVAAGVTLCVAILIKDS